MGLGIVQGRRQEAERAEAQKAQERRQYELRRESEAEDRRRREEVEREEKAKQEAKQQREWQAQEPYRRAEAARQERKEKVRGRWKKVGWGLVVVWGAIQVGIPMWAMLTIHSRPTPSAVSGNPIPAYGSELSLAVLDERSKEELDLMRNEPYARHGFKFGKGKTNATLRAHFSKFPWYHPTTGSMDPVTARLNPVELHNVRLILKYEKEHRMR